MSDRNKSGFVLRLVTAPHRSDRSRADSTPTLERADEHECTGMQVDDPDVDAPAHATDAGPLFW